MRNISLYCAVLLFAAPCYAEPSDEDRQINQLILRQDIITLNNVATPEDFVPDKVSNTLQIVVLKDPTAQSRVSEDGEVIFLNPDLPVNIQNALTHEAFRRKLKRLQTTK